MGKKIRRIIESTQKKGQKKAQNRYFWQNLLTKQAFSLKLKKMKILSI